MRVIKAEFARLLAARSGRTVESCQVSIAQWCAAGHLREGEGLAGGEVVLPDAARFLIGRLDTGQAMANGEPTLQALADLAELDQAADTPADGVSAPDADAADSAEDGLAVRLRALGLEKAAAQTRRQQAEAGRAELKLAAEAGALLSREAAAAAMAQVLQAEVTAMQQFLDDMAGLVAGAHNLDAAAVRADFRERWRRHRINRAAVQEKAAAAIAAAAGERAADLADEPADDLPNEDEPDEEAAGPL